MKIFRKIRMRLLGDGKSKRYFVYALGEVALIILGILIAMSISNWNEDQKDRVNERQYLTALVSDLDKDIDLSESAIQGNAVLLLGVYDLLEMLASPNEDENYWRTVFIHTVKDTYWYMSVDYSESTLGQLVNNNGIRLIQDEEVSNAILKYDQGLVLYKNQYAFLASYFHEMEETQKTLFDLRLARRAFIFLEEDHNNMTRPIEEFQAYIQEGDYRVNKDPNVLSSYYGDVLFYESNVKYFTELLCEQQRLAIDLRSLIESRYSL